MIETKQAFRIKIFPTIKKSIQLAFENRKILFLYCWLPFVAYLIYLNLSYFYPRFSNNFTLPIQNILYNLGQLNLYTLFIDAIITFAFIIPLYRYLILNKTELKTWIYKRGIETPKVIFRLFWSFKLSKKEAIAIMLFTFILAFFAGLDYFFKDLIMEKALEKLSENMPYDGLLKSLYVIKYTIILISGLLLASLILIWPTIALTDRFNLSKILASIKKVDGNIFRIYIVLTLIFLPYIIFNYSGNFIPLLLNNLDQIYIDIILVILNTTSTFLYFTCLCVEVAFISLIYKKINDTGDNNEAVL